MEVGSRPFESLALAPSVRLAMAVACALHVVLVAIVLPPPRGHHPADPGVRPPGYPREATTTTTPTLATTPTVYPRVRQMSCDSSSTPDATSHASPPSIVMMVLGGGV